jgi:hypothetical protein
MVLIWVGAGTTAGSAAATVPGVCTIALAAGVMTVVVAGAVVIAVAGGA